MCTTKTPEQTDLNLGTVVVSNTAFEFKTARVRVKDGVVVMV